jgi:DNA-directed RNA polymerase specialized sigma subunit
MAALAVEVPCNDEKSTDQRAVHAALELWARWSYSVLSAIGWPRSNIIARMIELGIRGAAQSAGLRELEMDETCEKVDKAVRRLDETEREVIVRTYLGHADASQVVAQNCGLTYQYYRQVLSRARQRVGDYMAGWQK